MLNSTRKSEKIFTIENSSNAVENFKSIIEKKDCKNMTVDISSLNMIDATKCAVLCSTQHYIKYPQGLIKWIVASREVLNLVKPFGLNNSVFLSK